MSFWQACMDKNVSLRLKEELKALDIKQLQLAERLDVATKTVGRWLKGTPIPSDKLVLLGKEGIDIVYVLTGERRGKTKQVGIEWIEIEHSGKALTAGYDHDSGTVLAPASLSGIPDGEVLICTMYDSTPTSQHRGRLFVPADWLMEEFPDSVEECQSLAAQVRNAITRAETIDAVRFERIIDLLEGVAAKAGKQWPARKLALTTVQVYNYLLDEPDAEDEAKVERVLKLVVNN